MTPQQLAFNKELTAKIVIVEHVLGLLKLFIVIVAVYRNRTSDWDNIFIIIITGIKNLELSH